MRLHPNYQQRGREAIERPARRLTPAPSIEARRLLAVLPHQLRAITLDAVLRDTKLDRPAFLKLLRELATAEIDVMHEAGVVGIVDGSWRKAQQLAASDSDL